MNRYPALCIDTKAIYKNAKIIKALCNEKNINPAAVIKGYNCIGEIVEKIILAGYNQIASSRLKHLKFVKEHKYNVETLALRVPMMSEVEEIIKWCDISLNSELEIIKMLDDEARKQNKIHKIILMRDLGDLREGIFLKEDFVETAYFIENNLKNVYLYGVGANFSCYGSVIPTLKNLTELSENLECIEAKINRKLDVVSGGATSTIPLLHKEGLPSRINHLRIGEATVAPYDLLNNWKCNIEGLSNDTFTLKAEIIEINRKPTYPIGKLGKNCFGVEGYYVDRGIRRRALLAIGNFDLGDCMTLIPKDENIQILGASSDHTIIDIEDCNNYYKLGDIVEFNVRYQSMLFTTNSDLISREIV